MVRTEKIRAIEAKYYGRVARTYVIGPAADASDEAFTMAHGRFLRTALDEYAAAAKSGKHTKDQGWISTLRYARIPDDRAVEWAERLADLAQEFTGEARDGETKYGLVIALYPTDRPHLEDKQ